MLDNEKKVEGSYRILVVDDCPELLELARLWLEDCGFTVVVAANAYEALTRFYAEGFDLVMTGLNMPGMNGNQLARHIRALDFKVPLAAVTSIPSDADRSCFNLVMSKPYMLAKLEHALLSLLQRSDNVTAIGALTGQLEPMEFLDYAH